MNIGFEVGKGDARSAHMNTDSLLDVGDAQQSLFALTLADQQPAARHELSQGLLQQGAQRQHAAQSPLPERALPERALPERPSRSEPTRPATRASRGAEHRPHTAPERATSGQASQRGERNVEERRAQKTSDADAGREARREPRAEGQQAREADSDTETTAAVVDDDETKLAEAESTENAQEVQPVDAEPSNTDEGQLEHVAVAPEDAALSAAPVLVSPSDDGAGVGGATGAELSATKAQPKQARFEFFQTATQGQAGAVAAVDGADAQNPTTSVSPAAVPADVQRAVDQAVADTLSAAKVAFAAADTQKTDVVAKSDAGGDVPSVSQTLEVGAKLVVGAGKQVVDPSALRARLVNAGDATGQHGADAASEHATSSTGREPASGQSPGGQSPGGQSAGGQSAGGQSAAADAGHALPPVGLDPSSFDTADSIDPMLSVAEEVTVVADTDPALSSESAATSSSRVRAALPAVRSPNASGRVARSSADVTASAQGAEASSEGNRQRSVTKAVNYMAIKNAASFDVEVPDLGRMRIDARSISGEVDVDVRSPEHATVAVLQSASASLESELRNEAIDLRSLDIRHEDETLRHGQHSEERGADKRDAHAEPRSANGSEEPDSAKGSARNSRVRIVL